MTTNALHAELAKIAAEAAFPIAARAVRMALLDLADGMDTSGRDGITSDEVRAEAARFDLAAPDSPAALEKPVARERRSKALDLWLLERDADEVDYEEVASVVVIASNGDDAREMACTAWGGKHRGDWWLPSTTVTHLGQALPGAPGAVVHASYKHP